MGNICSSDRNEAEPFSQPGRVIGSASASNRPPNAAPRAPLPAKTKAPFKSPGRTLGEAAPEVQDAERADARTNAAIAAQKTAADWMPKKRAESAAGAQKGKLGSKLAAQKAQTQAKTLSEVSREQTAARHMDELSEARKWT
ncbi:hypothetical protein CNMCM5793_006603 [Aspergillus hiratsukae]|uniref:Uncharacterized protein n=1 Tax=Aspergillus hiratsukae TaxID=1194566 RepID=A0A8H6UCT9_9EURO|nr:hypothetical protein CNMCM5793_006603 [Aspergillus hiratsukae]